MTPQERRLVEAETRRYLEELGQRWGIDMISCRSFSEQVPDVNTAQRDVANLVALVKELAKHAWDIDLDAPRMMARG